MIENSEQRTTNSKDNLKLVVGWLYPRQMSTYGDRGNILTIYKRCLWRNIEVEVKEIDLKERINPAAIDLYFFGGGQDQAQKLVSKDLQDYKKESLRKAARLGAVFLGICGGYQLLGHYYRPAAAEELPGLGLLDIVTVAGEKRMIGNIVIETDDKFKTEDGDVLVGFENHSGKTYLGKKSSPLGKVTVGYGNNGEDRTEGAFQANVFGCYLHGPLLPKNPAFADFLIRKALERRYGKPDLTTIDDTVENQAHEAAIERAKEAR
jgi:CobQ-like glutamine amidotransferase family enzyme